MDVDANQLGEHFQIQSEVDLDFVISQSLGWPVGMTRTSPPEFRRRVLAGALSYGLQLQSIDYTLKRYVESDLYEEIKPSVGDTASDFLRSSTIALQEGIFKLHTEDPAFGVFGAEFTLYRIPHALDAAR